MANHSSFNPIHTSTSLNFSQNQEMFSQSAINPIVFLYHSEKKVPKSPAYVVGELVLRPIIDVIYSFSSDFFQRSSPYFSFFYNQTMGVFQSINNKISLFSTADAASTEERLNGLNHQLGDCQTKMQATSQKIDELSQIINELDVSIRNIDITDQIDPETKNLDNANHAKYQAIYNLMFEQKKLKRELGEQVGKLSVLGEEKEAILSEINSLKSNLGKDEL